MARWKVTEQQGMNDDSISIDSDYRGDVYRGRRHGTGVFRHGQNPLTYDGEWNMGNMHGRVSSTDSIWCDEILSMNRVGYFTIRSSRAKLLYG